MQVGLDTFTLHQLSLTPRQMLDYIKAHGLAGAQFGGLRGLSATLDRGELADIRAYADALGLYSYVSAPSPNPHTISGSLEEHREEMARQIAAAAAHGWHELHTALGGPDERYFHPVAWRRQLADAADFIRSLGPVLRRHGSRLNLETHGDTTTFELVRLVEEIGPDILGICLDTANVFCFAEDPVWAARRAAPYTHLTHTKDAIIFPTLDGYRRQVRPPGQGALDWPRILPALAEYAPDLPLSIEDHKWWYDVPVFAPHWLAQQPDLTREELARVMHIAVRCQQNILAGEIEDPEAYEAVPYPEQISQRLGAARDYLHALLAQSSDPCYGESGE